MFFMFSEDRIVEIREHLENSVNPLFMFDNDQDGFCSYLLLRRMLGRGNGVAVKTSPLNMNYYRYVREFEPDCVFVLDKPIVDLEFFYELEKDGIRVVWIDHHECDVSRIPKNVHYYNPLYNGNGEAVPVTAQCYRISGREEDIWIGVLGCISDRFVPDFYPRFLELYPDLGVESDDAFKVLYGSEIGKISRMIGSGLKDRTSNVVRMIKYFYTVKTPYDVLEEGNGNYIIHKRFYKIDKKFNEYIKRARRGVEGRFVVFKYSGETSMSADISNKLSYLYPDKYIIVAFIKGGRVNLSLRGRGIREICQKIIGKFSLATCGGHMDAIGAQLNEDEVDRFILEVKNAVNLEN